MKSIRKSMWGMYWKLHDKRKRLAASLKGYLDGLPPETRRRIVLGMFAAFAVLALYTFGRAVYDLSLIHICRCTLIVLSCPDKVARPKGAV